MGGEQTGRVAMMAIRPEFAHAIMDGHKTVEFRKQRLADDISVVYIYATAPESQIVGWFTIDTIVEDTPRALWRQFKARGVIRYRPFMQYYAGRRKGVAILVAQAHQLSKPIRLRELNPQPAVPQSFVYLAADSLPH